MDIITMGIAIGTQIWDATKPQQAVFWNYIFLRWLGGTSMTMHNTLVNAEVENSYEFKRVEGKVAQEEFIRAAQLAEGILEYKNMFGVLLKSLPKIENNLTQLEMDIDKLKRLKDLSKEFSSEEMQEYVAGILAGEYNKPGSFSLQTISTMRNISRSELEIFIKFSPLLLDKSFFIGDVFSTEGDDFRNKNGFEYTDLLFLEELGLVGSQESEMHIGKAETENGKFFTVGDYNLSITFKNILVVNVWSLSKVGREILQLIEPAITPLEYYNWLKEYFEKMGAKVQFNSL